MKTFLKNNILLIAFLQALIAMLGSLYFSEILHFPPCVLCWYQRICLYPLVAILGIGYFRNDKKVFWYVLPLSIIALCIGIYHNLLYYNIIPEAIAPCRMGVSCTTKFIQWFGFLTIPLLALIAETVITVCMIIFIKVNKKKKVDE
jgi:disulfide bond formation protein DsbB